MGAPASWLSTASLVLLCTWPQVSRADRARARSLATEGAALAEQGRYRLALERYEKAIVADPDYHRSYQLALPLWLRFEQLSKARAELETLTMRCGDCVFAWYALGALYRKGGRFDLAVLAYQAYLAKRPKDPDALFGLAMALAASDEKSAVPVLRRYLKLEDRADREAFRQQAKAFLKNFGGSAKPAVGKPPHDARVQRLITEGRLASARRLLELQGEVGHRPLLMHAQIAHAEGQWFSEASYRALAWFWGRSAP